MKFYYLMKLSFELYEDQGFCCGDISKQYWLLLITNFQCFFHVFSENNLALWVAFSRCMCVYVCLKQILGDVPGTRTVQLDWLWYIWSLCMGISPWFRKNSIILMIIMIYALIPDFSSPPHPSVRSGIIL